ncbi:glycoside hydrolase family 3 protein [Geovibrio thiophilus]|nr:glycoside hydrolase family 3 protein [Geovibrio thiophilus]
MMIKAFFVCLFTFSLSGMCLSADLSVMTGQMIMIGVKDTSPEGISLVKTQIAEGKIGGVVLYKYNIENPRQIRRFNNDLKKAAGNGSPVLFTAVDQEGGRVQRLVPEKGFGRYLSHQETAAKLTPEQAFEQYFKMASEAAAAGFNVNFAPSADLNVNPDSPIIGRLGRSFSADAGTAVVYAGEFVKAHNKAGIAASIKHFPGHGSAMSDSHLGFTDVTDTWTEKELEPFRLLIEKGLAPSVMTAHVFNAKIDPVYPATMSEKHLGILRERMGYDGVIFTDDLQMGAVRDNFPLEEVIVRAVQAGADVLVYSNFFFNDPDFPHKAADIIKKAVEDGRISIGSIERSYARILELKRNLR